MEQQSPHPVTSTPSPALVRALVHILRPLVKLLLHYGVTYPYLANLLKSIYLEVATREFQLDNKPQTDSRLSLLTGLHRKDIKRLANSLESADSVPAVVSLGATLIARWSADPDYLDQSGQPCTLPRFLTEGRVSFESLVTGVNKDIRPRSVLDEWLRLGIVQMDQNNHVCLSSAAFIPAQGADEMAFYFGQNIRDHLAATVHNLTQNSPPFLERSVYYDNLTPESVAKLTELSRTLGMRTLQAVNRQALELERADQSKSEANQRMNFGVYFFSEPILKTTSTDKDKDRD
jgi:hypothetical protein